MKKIKIKVKKPWIAYPGPPIQQGYAEDTKRGYLLWDIKSANHFDVEFRKLQNYQPYVTVDWEGSTKKLSKQISDLPFGSRIRIKSDISISQKDINEIQEIAKKIAPAEITFKVDEEVDRDIVNTGEVVILKQDIRNIDTLVKLFNNFYKNDQYYTDNIDKVTQLIKKYLDHACSVDVRPMNIKWSVKRLEFDNTFSYGEGNIINFDSMNGITGIFGQNRIGKSSIVGTLLYTLFNSTDRGAVKNLHVINARKNHCVSRALLEVDGSEYFVERQTVKHENKKLEILGTTSLNLARLDSGKPTVDLNGDQRNDTEKSLRKLIGEPEDYTLTGLSAQGDLLRFVNDGATSRKITLARFLDLDIFEKMYSHANDDLIEIKSLIKNTKDLDWDSKISNFTLQLESLKEKLTDIESNISKRRFELDDKKLEISGLAGKKIVTSEDVQKQQNIIFDLEKKISTLELQKGSVSHQIDELNEKISKIDKIQSEFSVDELRERLSKQNLISKNLQEIKFEYDTELNRLTQQEKSFNKLQQVPCGDSFPTCMYIKDSHLDKQKIPDQKIKVASLLSSYKKIELLFEETRDDKLENKIRQFEAMNDSYGKLQLNLSDSDSILKQTLLKIEDLQLKHASELSKLELLQKSFNSNESEEILFLRKKIDQLQIEVATSENEKYKIVSDIGKFENQIHVLSEEKKKYEEVTSRFRLLNLVAVALSKRGIPNQILYSQLPLINAELSKILGGILDFNIELQSDLDSNAMDIYINYGDSRRLIELGSGMEKTIASIAIRVALLQITSMPKTDLFIVDEGFGTLDAAQIEVCNRFLVSLKKYFKNIIIISHVEAMKDIVDNLIEINKIEKDSKVVVN